MIARKLIVISLWLCPFILGCHGGKKDSTKDAAAVDAQGTNVYEFAHQNGQIAEYGVYVDGIPIGVHRTWDQKGNLVSAGLFKNGKPWHGTFYLYGAGDWFFSVSNAVPLEGTLPIPDGLTDHNIWLYQRNGAYRHAKAITNDYWDGYLLRSDWSAFPGYWNYEEDGDGSS